MTSPIRRVLNPYSYGLYFWTFWLVAVMAHVTLHDRLPIDPRIVFPCLWASLIAIFLFVLGLRLILLDIVNGMNVREKMGLFLICATLFFTPMLLPLDLPFSICLLSLEIPLLFLMVDARGFARIYLINLLLLVGFCLEHYDDFGASMRIILMVLFLLTVCFVLDYFCFRTQRSSQKISIHFFRVHLLALKYYLGIVIIGFALFGVTPSFRADPVPAQIQMDMLQQPRQARYQTESLSLPEIQVIVFQTALLLLSLVLLVAVMNYLRRKWALKRSEEATVIESTVARMFSRIHPSRKSAPPASPSGSPREKIFKAYYWFCERAAAIGIERKQDQTPSEFADYLARDLAEHSGGRQADVESSARDITRTFESVRYGEDPADSRRAALYLKEIKEFFQNIADRS